MYNNEVQLQSLSAKTFSKIDDIEHIDCVAPSNDIIKSTMVLSASYLAKQDV